MRIRAIGIVMAATLTLAGCSLSDAGNIVESTATGVPSGFRSEKNDNFQMSIPDDWKDRGKYKEPSATVEWGVEYANQTFVPPSIKVWVDRTKGLGSVDLHSAAIQTMIKGELQSMNVDMGEREEAKVNGAKAAMVFTYSYDNAEQKILAGEITIAAARYKIRHLEALPADGDSPMFSFRYVARESDFDEQVWKTMIDTLVVHGDKK